MTFCSNYFPFEDEIFQSLTLFTCISHFLYPLQMCEGGPRLYRQNLIQREQVFGFKTMC